MSILYVAEFSDIQRHSNSVGGVPVGPPLRTQTVAFTGTAGTIANALGTDCYLVQISTDGNAAVAMGSAPTAVATDMHVPANVPQYLAVNPADLLKVSAKAVT